MAQHEQGNQRGTFRATALFADISGFTALTEQLMQQNTEGAEVLSEILDVTFKPLVRCAVQHGGIIPHFAGDAFAAIFEGEKTNLVAAVAEKFRGIIEENSVFDTPFGRFKINIRIGLSFGIAEWGIVGESLKSYYFKGTALERAVVAQQMAQPQQIVLDAWFYRAFVASSEASILPLADAFYVLERAPSLPEPKLGDDTPPSVSMPILRAFLPPSIINFSEKGEFRTVVSVFFAFNKVDEYADIDTIARTVLSAFQSFGGYFKEIEFNEKGCIMVGFFGAPIAYETNASRALTCVNAIKEAISKHPKPFPFRCGLTSGMAFSGIVGGEERCQYAIVGKQVNLAARLMQNAEWGNILVDKSLSQVPQFDFLEDGEVTYKGITAPVPTFRFLAQHTESMLAFSGKVVGRERELFEISLFAERNRVLAQPAFVHIFGEPGVGKSRLVYELHKMWALERSSFHWATCPADQILRKPFNPFVHYLKIFFEQKNEDTTPQNQQAFERIFDQLIRNLPEAAYTEGVELIRVQFVLAALVGLPSTDGIWEMLDARGRYDNTFAALAAFFMALAHQKTLIIDLEDTHWLDDDSAAFLAFFVKKVRKMPILLVATARPNDEGEKLNAVDNELLTQNDWQQLSVDLSALSIEGLMVLAEQKLKGVADKNLADLLWRTSNGNPFYAEQILDYFVENGLLLKKMERTPDTEQPSTVWSVRDKNIKISNSISAILTARIDRLSSLLKETVKAAAVIGREFELPVLNEVMLSQEEYAKQVDGKSLLLKEQVLTAERGQIWRAMNELRYIFRHALLREAVYDMQLKTRLRELHAIIARAIEKIYAENLDDRFLDLAFHYEQADDRPNANQYLKKAGDFARRNFQNQLALELVERLLKNVENTDEHIGTLLQKGELLQIMGRWHEAELTFHTALFEAAHQNAALKVRAHLALGTLQMLKGEYEQASVHLQKSAALNDQSLDNESFIAIYGTLGTLHFRQGEYNEASDYFEKSITVARALNRRINAQIVANWGLTHMNRGNYTEGVLVLEEALWQCEAEGDIVGMATLHVNLGIVMTEKGDDNEALQQLESGLELAQKLGNKQLISIALGCVGNVWLNKGAFAKALDFLEQDRQMVEELGDRQGIAIVSELMGKYHLLQKNYAIAEKWLEKSLSYAQQLHYQKGVAKAYQGLGKVASAANDYEKAHAFFDQAIALAKAINNQYLRGFCLVDKGLVALAQGKMRSAIDILNEAENVSAFLQNPKLERHILSFQSKLKVAIDN